MTLKEIRQMTGLTQAAFSRKYGIPKRTIENWESSGAAQRTPPGYVLSMLERIVKEDLETGETKRGCPDGRLQLVPTVTKK